MLRVGVIGVNHKLADLKLREQLAKACQKYFSDSEFIINEQFVILSTCNRTEIYFSAEDLAEAHTYLLSILRIDIVDEFEHKLYSYFGIDCFIHLLKVTTGLDSAIIGETEIQGQVKKAYESVLEYRYLTKELHFLFQKSLGVSKKIRSELNFARGIPTLEGAIYHTGKEFFGDMKQPKILFIGASDINQKIWEYFIEKELLDISICNRTQHSCFSSMPSVKFLEWKKLSFWEEFDWIIFGTKAQDYLVNELFIADGHSKLIMDLSVPRNVNPLIGLETNVTLLNIDQINEQLQIKHQGTLQIIEEAENRIQEAAHNQVSHFAEREKNKIQMMA